MGIRKCEPNEIDSDEESEDNDESKTENDTLSPIKNISASQNKKPKTFLDPISDPDLNPNLPDLLHKKSKGLRRA